MLKIVGGQTTAGGDVQTLLQEKMQTHDTILFLVSSTESIPWIRNTAKWNDDKFNWLQGSEIEYYVLQ
jgi:hypothetical protein